MTGPSGWLVVGVFVGLADSLLTLAIGLMLVVVMSHSGESSWLGLLSLWIINWAACFKLATWSTSRPHRKRLSMGFLIGAGAVALGLSVKFASQGLWALFFIPVAVAFWIMPVIVVQVVKSVPGKQRG